MEVDTGEEPATRVAQDSGGAGSSMDHVRARVPVAMEAPGSRDDGLSQGVVAGEEREDHGREEEGEEGESPKGVRAPLRVRKEEREAHELTHTPYRAWCRHCVRARGRNAPHRTRDEERKAGGIPKVAMDYFFMSAADEHAHENPIIVMIDESTGEKYARAVGQKGLGREAGDVDWLIKDMSQELKAWGHAGGEAGHIILKCDGERSIKAVRDALAKYHGGKVVPEDPPRGESQSNGVVEEAGKTTREFVRVLKEQVEHSANIKLECAEVLTEWMVRWAAMLCSRYVAKMASLRMRGGGADHAMSPWWALAKRCGTKSCAWAKNVATNSSPSGEKGSGLGIAGNPTRRSSERRLVQYGRTL